MIILGVVRSNSVYKAPTWVVHKIAYSMHIEQTLTLITSILNLSLDPLSLSVFLANCKSSCGKIQTRNTSPPLSPIPTHKPQLPYIFFHKL